MFVRILKLHLSRFGLEILLFVLLSLANTATFAAGVPPDLTRVLSRLEAIMLVWITIRLVLAEDGFRSSGSWRIRPLGSAAVHLSPVLLAMVVVGIPVMIRAIVLKRFLSLDSGEILELMASGGVGAWLAFVGLVKLFGMLILRSIDGKARAAAWAVFCLLVLAILLPMAASRGRHGETGGGGGMIGSTETHAIRRLLTDATDYIGNFQQDLNNIDPVRAEVVWRIPLGNSGSGARPAASSASATVRGGQTLVVANVFSADPGVLRRIEGAIPLLRYAGGVYATGMEFRSARIEGSLPLLSPSRYEYRGTFFGPAMMPEYRNQSEEMLRGAELVFVAIVDGGPLPEAPVGLEEQWTRQLATYDVFPAAPPVSRTDELRRYVMWLMDWGLDADFAKGNSGFASNRGGYLVNARLPREALPLLFDRAVWPDAAWMHLVQPHLLRYADQADIPLLLERLRNDRRLIGVFMAKGWPDAAIPTLRELLQEGIPLELEYIEALLRLKDASLSEALATQALRLGGEVARLELMLREQPGFDWPAYVLEGWKRAKYGVGANSALIYANWAAQVGDPSGFRRTAEQAAMGKRWERSRLAELIEGDQEDPVWFVRGRIDRMVFDPTVRKWREP